MRIESLELFLTVASHGSISHAARQHFISQQGVSSAIKSLEKDFGFPLFERRHNGLELTRRGSIIRNEAEKIVESHRRMMVLASSVPSKDEAGKAIVDVLTTPFVSSALEEVFLDYESVMPDTRLRIIERDLFRIVGDFAQGSQQARHATSTGRAPLVIVPCMAGMDKTIERMGNAFEPLVPSELMAVCPVHSKLALRDSITREELCEHPIVFYSETFLNKVVARLFEGFSPNIQQNTSNVNLLARAIEYEGAVSFSDSFSMYLSRRDATFARVPIKNSVMFVIGFLGKTDPGSPEEQFANFFRRYLLVSCGPYMERYGGLAGDSFARNGGTEKS